MAAINAVVEGLLRHGDHIVASKSVNHTFFTQMLKFNNNLRLDVWRHL